MLSQAVGQEISYAKQMPVELKTRSNNNEETPQPQQPLERLRFRGAKSLTNRSQFKQANLLSDSSVDSKKLTIVWQQTFPNHVTVKLQNAISALNQSGTRDLESEGIRLPIKHSNFFANSVGAQSVIGHYLLNRANKHIDTVEFFALDDGKPSVGARVWNWVSRKDYLASFQTFLSFLIQEIKQKPVDHFKIYMSEPIDLWERLGLAKMDHLNKDVVSIGMSKLLKNSDSSNSTIEEVSFEQLDQLVIDAREKRAKLEQNSPTGGFL